MASYNVTLYIDSGFNAINIPDTPATLEASAGGIIKVAPVVILQNRFLGSVRVSVNWDAVKNCDYCRIGSMYYSVQGIRMLSDSTAELSITPDFITSAGGFRLIDGAVTTDFQILDGITERATVSVDDFGLYTDADPLTAPQQTLQLETEWDIPGNVNNTGMYLVSEAIGVDPNSAVLCETSIDLAKMYTEHHGKTYQTPGGDVTVPQVENIAGSETSFGFESDPNVRVSNGTRIYVKNQNKLEDGAGADAQQTIEAGISQARSLGVESAIFDQWAVPTRFLGLITYTNSKLAVENPDSDEVESVTDQRVSMVQGKHGTISTGLNPKYSNVKNNRVLYGEYNSYGIITCAGNSCTFKPEEILTKSEFDAGKSPDIDFNVDPRAQGKPYYRFKHVNGNDEFWRNALAGETWARVPLIYESASGSELTRFTMANSIDASNQVTVSHGISGVINQITSLITGGQSVENRQEMAGYNIRQAQIAQNMGTLTSSRAISARGAQLGAGMAEAGFIAQGIGMVADDLADIHSYSATLHNELSQLYTTQTVYVPQVAFSYNPAILRDLKNNGIMLFRYRYKDTDLARIDKLLTMYGYKESEQVSTSNFYRRTKFDFVQCGSITITGLPRWWNDGISLQLRNGVRVWHTKPDVSAYNDNPIRR